MHCLDLLGEITGKRLLPMATHKASVGFEHSTRARREEGERLLEEVALESGNEQDVK